MHRFRISFFSICSVFVVSAFMMNNYSLRNSSPLNIGDKIRMANHKVVDVSGKSVTLNETSGENGLLVMFTCNTCPWVAKWEDRFNTIAQTAKINGIGMIALNPNEAIRDRGESMKDMQDRAKRMNYSFNYALDKNNQLADAFGATHTPEIFLFDKQLTLVYHGAIDDNAASADGVDEHYALDAMNQLVNGEKIATSETRSLGCTIKRINQ